MSDESLTRHLSAPEVKTLRLSEAIRIGARLRPQCAGTFFSSYGESCAIGAAIEGITGQPIYSPKTFENLFAGRGLSGTEISRLYLEITHRNDSGQSREQIADWLQAQGL